MVKKKKIDQNFQVRYISIWKISQNLCFITSSYDCSLKFGAGRGEKEKRHWCNYALHNYAYSWKQETSSLSNCSTHHHEIYATGAEEGRIPQSWCKCMILKIYSTKIQKNLCTHMNNLKPHGYYIKGKINFFSFYPSIPKRSSIFSPVLRFINVFTREGEIWYASLNVWQVEFVFFTCRP